MAEEPPPMTLQQRIAALNAAHDSQNSTKYRSFLVPVNGNSVSASGSSTTTTAAPSGGSKATPPALPIRKIAPPLPARKDSADSAGRPSFESSSSVVTTSSDTSRSAASRSTSSDRIKAPAWGESELPALPPRGQASQPRKFSTEKPKYVNRAPCCDSAPVVAPAATPSPAKRPSQPPLPPRLPTRSAVPVDLPAGPSPQPQDDVNCGSQLKDSVKSSALSYALNKPQTAPEANKLPTPSALRVPAAVGPTSTNSVPGLASLGLHRAQSQPPPTLDSIIQASPPPSRPSQTALSKPDLSAILATKPKPRPSPKAAVIDAAPRQSDDAGCLVCRDFSLADSHATQFPRHGVSNLQDLAYSLTAPFASATDKARVICTWLHLNIAYDVDNFFRGTVKSQRPESTLESGLAVCEGYAQLFNCLATLAGLDSIAISGHGKGFGYVPVEPGSSLPPFQGNHAWNAVKIDGGEWKLIDSCWYAGHIQGPGMPFMATRHDSMFTMSNEEFGIKHFPHNKDHFFLPAGLTAMTWEQYIQTNPDHWPHGFQPPLLYSVAEEEYFIGRRTVAPQSRQISIRQGGHVRFQFGLRCPHWDLAKHTKPGPPPVFLMQIHGLDGRKTDLVPFEHVSSVGGGGGGGGGDLWYVDIPAAELGAPGQKVSCMAITSFGDSTDCRGLSVAAFREKKGRIGMGFAGVAAWDLIA